MCENWPHHPGLRPLLLPNSGVGSFTSHKNQVSVSAVRRDLRFLSLSEKTRKSNRLRMSLQRQLFVLSYLKTLGVGPAGFRTRDLQVSRPALSQLRQPGGGLIRDRFTKNMGRNWTARVYLRSRCLTSTDGVRNTTTLSPRLLGEIMR